MARQNHHKGLNKHQKAAHRPGEEGVGSEMVDLEFKLAGRSEFDLRGKCDFCGRAGQRVKRDLDTLIPAGGTSRAGLICRSCAGEAWQRTGRRKWVGTKHFLIRFER